MSVRNRQGFTMAEVMIAMVMLSVGVMALVGSSAAVTRMVGRGRNDTMAGQVATARLERLRQLAASTATPCTHADWKTDSAWSGRVRERWEIINGTTANFDSVRIIVRYQVARGTKVDTVMTSILCR